MENNLTTLHFVDYYNGSTGGVPVSTRSFYLSNRFQEPFILDHFKLSFVEGTNQLLEIRLWITTMGDSHATLSNRLANDTQPYGRSLLGGFTPDDFIVGNNVHGMPIDLGIEIPGGSRIMVDATNQDASNVHSVIVRAFVQEIITPTVYAVH